MPCMRKQFTFYSEQHVNDYNAAVEGAEDQVPVQHFDPCLEYDDDDAENAGGDGAGGFASNT
eukprot:963841-Pleurochrysis_carterae.AAC.1